MLFKRWPLASVLRIEGHHRLVAFSPVGGFTRLMELKTGFILY